MIRAVKVALSQEVATAIGKMVHGIGKVAISGLPLGEILGRLNGVSGRHVIIGTPIGDDATSHSWIFSHASCDFLRGSHPSDCAP